MSYGYFDDARRSFVVTDPVPPKPWTNYLTNRRLSALISHQAGGLVWYKEPLTRRISRYHYIPAPADRPGFYVYINDRTHGTLWNPHFAPTCATLDEYACHHEPGVSTFHGEKDGVRVDVAYAIPPDDDVMLWQVTVENAGAKPVDLQLTSYLEFGLLEFLREVYWCYLKAHIGFSYDAASRAIRYDYHAFEAPFTPRMAFGCTADVACYECSRDQFIGRAGSLERPTGLINSLTNSEIPNGGHGAGVLATEMTLAPGARREFAYRLAVADNWDAADGLLAQYGDAAAVARGLQATRDFWGARLETLQAETGDASVDRFINTWTPYNNLITLQLARIISVDHMGLDGLRYRDSTQDAMGGANLDPELATEQLRKIFAVQKQDGAGCCAFYPDTPKPPADEPVRADNTVWQIYSVKNLLAETGDWSFLDERIPYRDGGDDTVYGHILNGLKFIAGRGGTHGLPMLFHADWNDGLALFGDERAESVMLGMQMVHSCREFAVLADRLGRDEDAAWCTTIAGEMNAVLNSDLVWDGQWYKRLLLSNGTVLGSSANRQGRIFLNPQSWAVISGVGALDQRGLTGMNAVKRMLDTDCGVALLTPPYTGIPEPEDPPLGSSPGTNENGSIFAHANTWAIIAECLLGRADNAYKYYRQLMPEEIIGQVGLERYGREPYVYVSSIVGPQSARYGEGGISWLTGTVSWMYIAATHYLLGVQPTLDGLRLRPCLPVSFPNVHIRRNYRGRLYDITIDNAGRDQVSLEVDGQSIEGNLLPLPDASTVRVVCKC